MGREDLGHNGPHFSSIPVEVFREILAERSRLALNDLERRVRTGTGVREFRGKCCGAPDAPEPEEEQDSASRLIKEYTRPAALRDMVAPVMEQVSDIFTRIKTKGVRDGLTMDSATEIQVLRDTIKEALIRHILAAINSQNSGGYAAGSHDAGLLATPQGYFAGDLESISPDTIRNLMELGYGYQDDFMSEADVDKIYGEMEYFDFDGKYVEVQQQKISGYRTDRIGWFTPESLDREKQPGLSALFKKMISIPFELNKKCSLYLQASANFQLSCYAEKARYKKHVDGGYNDLNNGRKITAIFYPNSVSWSSRDGGHLKMYKRKPNPFQVAKMEEAEREKKDPPDEEAEQIAPSGGRLVLFRSRDMPHEVMPCCRKRYAVSLWLMGPAGPGDQQDHYTPT